MPTGIGIDAMEVGGELVGRTALDDRLLVRSEFHNLGVVMGCAVTGSATAMAYNIGPGTDPVSVAVGSRSGADGATKFVVPHGTVATTAAPASGSRIDVVWALQHDPAKGDSDNQAITGVTQGVASPSPSAPSIPSGAVPLMSFTVPQGAVRGSQCTPLEPGNLAIPYGSSLGEIYRFHDNFNGRPVQTRITKGAGSFVLPTRRRVELVLRPTISTPATDNEGSVLYRFLVDGQEVGAVEQGFNRFWQTYHLSALVSLDAGRHTVSYTQERRAMQSHMSDYVQRAGTNEGNKFLGTTFTVEDRGLAAL